MKRDMFIEVLRICESASKLLKILYGIDLVVCADKKGEYCKNNAIAVRMTILYPGMSVQCGCRVELLDKETIFMVSGVMAERIYAIFKKEFGNG